MSTKYKTLDELVNAINNMNIADLRAVANSVLFRATASAKI